MKLTIAEKTNLGFNFWDSPTDEQIAQAQERKAAELAEYLREAAEYKATHTPRPMTEAERIAALTH